MNFSVYLLLAAVAPLTVFTQQSNDERVRQLVERGLNYAANGYVSQNNRAALTIRFIRETAQDLRDDNIYPQAADALEQGLVEGTSLFRVSENLAMGGVDAALRITPLSFEAAKQVVMMSIDNAQAKLVESGIPPLAAFGRALALSNETARQGLEDGIVSIEMVGFAAHDSLVVGRNLLPETTDSGPEANQLLFRTLRDGLKIGYFRGYDLIQDAMKTAARTLRAASAGTAQGQGIVDANCVADPRDPEVSGVLRRVNRIADDALSQGAPAELVEKLRTAVLCAVRQLGAAAIASIKTVQGLEPLARTAPDQVLTTLAQLIENGRQEVYQLSARVYAVIGEIAQATDTQLSGSIVTAITEFLAGKIKSFAEIESARDFIVLGIRYKGDAIPLSFEAANESGYTSKTSFLDTLIQVLTDSLRALTE